MEPIAIVGIGCRFPGSSNPESFWQLLRNGIVAITEIPKDRWDTDAFYDPSSATTGKMNTRWGGFIEQVDQFEPSFFGISPLEAQGIDPQQRLLLEVSWEALENAGIAPDMLAGSNTGVFVGICNSDYHRLVFQDSSKLNAYSGTGTTLSIAANRLSYILNLQGPSVVIDTACSSSLVAVHYACRSLHIGESKLCVVGGVNLMLTPEATISFSQARMMAADGRCKTFDASADGYVRGEGCGVVILKLLQDALKDGDNILSIIRGSAINHDGLTNGLTAPSGVSQKMVIRQALKNAELNPGDISYVEAHGTGTSLGDPIEVNALKSVLMEGRKSDQPCWIGSVKTNIGHLEAAAGIAGLLKVVLSLQHQEIPPHLNLKQLNRLISFEETPFSIPTEVQPWTTIAGHRFAGISSFGFGGSNAHLILEEAPSSSQVSSDIQRPLHLLVLSAKSEQALQELTQRYEDFLGSHPEISLADICFTTHTGRSHFKHRLSVVAESTKQLREQLGAFGAVPEISGLVRGQVYSGKPPKIAFLFTGQGSQYVNMGRRLYETQPTFRQVLDRCDQILRSYLEKSLIEVLYPPEGQISLLDETAYTQPTLFALEYALAELWKSWGICPDVVMGHSVGEYVAATIAGVFSLEDGLKLIATRGRLIQALPLGGEMVAVLASPTQVQEVIKPYASEVAIAAINGSVNVVISGAADAISTICDILQAKGIKTKHLQVSHAFHSPLMEPMLASFEDAVSNITYNKPRICIISNLTGGEANDDITTPQYWVNHVRQPVRFADSMKTLHQQGYEIFLEIGPKPILLGMGRQCLPEDVGVWLPSMRPDCGEWQLLLSSLGQLYVQGMTVNWSAFDRDYCDRKVMLPTYPFQRQRYWINTDNSHHKNIFLSKSENFHPLLGQRLYLAIEQKDILFQCQISTSYPNYLTHHRIFSKPVLPATAYLEMALAAGFVVFKSLNFELLDVDIQQALILPEDSSKTLQIVLTPTEPGSYSFQILSFTQNQENSEPIWTLHASGKVKKDFAPQAPDLVDIAAIQTQYPQEISVAHNYQQFQRIGIDYGPSFQAVTRIWTGESEALGQIKLPETLVTEASQYQLHPVLLDACFQVIGGIFTATEFSDAYLPARIERLRVYHRPNVHLWTQVKLLQPMGSKQQLKSANVSVLDPSGTVSALIEGLVLRRVNPKALQRILYQEDLSNWLYQPTWILKPKTAEQRSSVDRKQYNNWLIFAETTGIGAKLAEQLRVKGDNCVLVFASSKYKQITSEQYHIDPLAPADFQRLFQEINDLGFSPSGVVHLWGILESANQLSVGALQQAQSLACGSGLHLVQALLRYREQRVGEDISHSTRSLPASISSSTPHLWLVTKGAQAVSMKFDAMQVQQAPLWGLGKVIVLEHPEINCKCLDLDPLADDDTVSNLLVELSVLDNENQIAYRQGSRYVARLERYRLQTSKQQRQLVIGAEPFQLKITEYGILDNLTLFPITRRSPKAGEVEVQVRATGLNFRDVLNALGMLKEYSEQLGIKSADDLPFGGECAGKIVAVGVGVTNLKVGDEVIVAHAIGSFSSFVIVKADLVARKPVNISMEAAATIPVAFTTAHYALRCLAKIKPGERVLIHAAAGGVGLAAVQIAIQAGAIVFATASPSKWDFLKSMGVEHIFNSRNLIFAQQIMTITQGQGVDIVLNSLNGEFIPLSLKVLAPRGRFIEIGKIGIWEHQQMQATRSDVSYFPFDMLEIAINCPTEITTMLQSLLVEFNSGKLLPLPHKVFPIEKVVDAFRYMAQAKHIGKVVVSQPEIAANPLYPNVETFHGTSLVREDASYLITGGLGALGLLVAQWIVELGARHLILTSRRSPSEKALLSIERLEQMGARVLVAATDISQQEDVTDLMSQIHTKMPPLRGIIHAAGVLDDSILQQLNWERFTNVMAPKIQGAWHLHTLTKELPLDFFICFSSISALLGSPGQGNYAAANAFLDSLVYHRRALGLPGLSINWGPWAESGMAAHVSSRNLERWAAQGISPIASTQGLLLLGQLLEQNATQVGVLPVDWSKFIGQLPSNIHVPFLETFKSSNEQLEQKQSEFLKQLETTPVNSRRSLLMMHIRTEIAKVLGLSSAEQIGVYEEFTALGMDSLMAVELRNRLQTSLRCSISSTLAFDYPTVDALVNYLAQEVLCLEPTAESALEAQAALKKAEFSAKLTATNTQDLQADAVLDPIILPPTKESKPVTQVSQILLTGATGFVGAFLLHQLLEQTQASIYCLVRAHNVSEAQKKIQKNLEHYFLWQEHFNSRILPIVGDLAAPLLGLAEREFQQLASQIDVIYHNGAFVNLVRPYSSFREINVLGTQELLRFATQIKLKPVHHISTIATFISDTYTPGTIIVEDDKLPSCESLLNGYSQSKSVAEQLVITASDRGIPVSTYRLYGVAGHSQTGITSISRDITWQLVKGFVQIGYAPALDFHLDLTPVNYISSAIVHLSQQPESIGKAFHIVNPQPLSFNQFIKDINFFGYPIEQIPLELFLTKLRESSEQSEKNVLLPLLPTLEKASLLERIQSFSCQNTLEVLAKASIVCPPVDKQLLKTYLSYFRDINFFTSESTFNI